MVVVIVIMLVVMACVNVASRKEANNVDEEAQRAD